MRLKTTIDLFEYWTRIRGQDVAPLRSQVEPTHLRQILSSVFLLETSDSGRIAFRLAGTRICDLFDRDLRGVQFSELWAHGKDDIEQMAASLMSNAMPELLNATGFTAAGHRASFEIVLLPLRSDERECDKLLGAIAPAVASSWLEVVPLQFLALDRIRSLHEGLGSDGELKDAEFGDERPLYERTPSIADTMPESGVPGSVRHN